MLAFGSDDCQQSTEARYRISVCNEQNQCQPVTALHHPGLSTNKRRALLCATRTGGGLNQPHQCK